MKTKPQKIITVVLLLVWLVSCLPIQLGERIQTVMVPMPDGVKLATTIYLPETGDGPWPAVLWRTPYGRNSQEDFIEFGKGLAEIGVVAVMQDERGRHDSQGEDMVFFYDRSDGQATIDWIVSQLWSNGRVVSEGGSAMGVVQYFMAPGAPQALACQWIEVAMPDLYMDAVYQGGVYRNELASGWLQHINSAHLIEPFQAHSLNSDYWDPVQIVDDYAKVHVPAFHVGGYFDIFARGTIDAFLGYQYTGGEGAVGHQHLVMGPWTHAINEAQIGELIMPNAVLPELYDEWQWLWYEACAFAHVDLAELDALPAVTYFTMGAVGEEDAPGNEWHTATTWPPEGMQEVKFYLSGSNTLTIDPPREDENADAFTFDPTDPSPTICGANLMIEAGSCDQRSVEARGDVIVYSSQILEQPVEVTGDLQAEIWITTDVPDTDIVVRLTDVYPDGRSMLVADSIVRTRYHNSPDFTSFELLEPGQTYLLVLDLGPTSIIFNQGHQIRVSVTSSNWPRFSVNPNTGADFLIEGGDWTVAHTIILHDADHPSAIVLPIR